MAKTGSGYGRYITVLYLQKKNAVQIDNVTLSTSLALI